MRAWADVYRQWRGLLHSGRVVRIDTADAAIAAHGVVAASGDRALYSIATVGTPADALPPALRLPGLDAERRYAVRPVSLGPAPVTIADAPPAWYHAGVAEQRGRTLETVGLAVPLMAPEQLLLLEAVAL